MRRRRAGGSLRPAASGIAIALLFALPAGAQVTPPPDSARTDTLPRDTSATADTARVATAPPADTIKAPLPAAELPATPSIAAPYRWSRAELFATGAQSLLELLDLVPGVTTYRSGWLASPKIASYLGDAARVRVFLDGLEITSLNARTGGLLDLSDVQLWTLESVVLERGADEVRVFARSWRVDRTATSTRTDVATGDQDANIFRGFLGKRFRRGEALQLAGQQYGINGGPAGGGDELAVMGRVGWARGRWSADAFATRASLNRDARTRFDQLGRIPALDAQRTDAYVRAMYGRADSGFWAMAMAGAQRFGEETAHQTTAPIDTVDTARTNAQYVAAAGFSRSGVRLSLTNRHVRGEGQSLNAIIGRASLERGMLGLSLRAELRGGDSSSVEEAVAVLRPLRFLALSGAVARRHGGSGSDFMTVRGEAGLGVGRLWASGGVVRQEAHSVPGLAVFDTTFAPALVPEGTGLFGALRGRVYKDLGVDLYLMRWEDSAFYRPKLQGRAEVFLETRWLGRFPSGHFGFLGSIAYLYRSATLFPSAPAGGGPLTTQRLGDQHVGVARLEIRLLDATLFYQSQFGLYPTNTATLPGYLLPPQLQLYGVRWQFWN